MRRRARWWVAATLLAPLGCATALDLEGMGRLLRPEGPPEPPRVVDQPSSELVAPQGLRARSGELRKVPLSWEPVLSGDVTGYVVERSLREGGRFDRVVVLPERFATTWVDRGSDLAPKALAGRETGDLGDEATYHYRVRAFDSSGRASRNASSVVSATTAPRPPRPEDLRTYSNWPGKIALAWSPVDDSTVSGYVIYRSPSLRGDYLPVGRTTGRFATSWVDRGLAPLRVLYYTVAAVNTAGGEGIPSRAERGVTKPEPLPPEGLHVADRELGAIRLAWSPNVESNIARYRVLRRRAGAGSEELVAELGPERTHVADTQVGAGEVLEYRAVAVDTDGLESDPSEPVEAQGVGYELRATTRSGEIELRWDPRLQERYREARVLRLGTFGEREVARVPRPVYVDTGVRRGGTYRYVVVLVAEDGTEAPRSQPLEVEAR